MKFITFVFAAALLVGCGESEAAKVVKDPWNLAKNAVTAAQQARQTVINLEQLAVQQQDFILQTRNLARVSDQLVQAAIDRGMLPASAYGLREGAQIADKAAGVYQSLKSSQDEMQKMYQVLTQIQDLSQSIERQAIHARLNPAKLLQDQAIDAQAGREYAAREYLRLQADLGQLENHQRRMDQLAAAIPSSSGAQQSLQIMALQNGVLSDQLSQMLTVQTSQAAAVQRQEIRLTDQELKTWHIQMRALAARCRMGSKSPRCPEGLAYYDKYVKPKQNGNR